MRWCVVLLLAAEMSARAQSALAQENQIDDPRDRSQNCWINDKPCAAPIVESIEITGLRRISPITVRARIRSREGQPMDPRIVEADLRAIATLGWFRDVWVDVAPPAPKTRSQENKVLLRYRAIENSFLTSIGFSGSRVLSRSQIERIWKERNLQLRLGEPANDVLLQQAAFVIRHALGEAGHPEATVTLEKTEFAAGTVRVRFVIGDGPRLDVGRVVFAGQTGLQEKELKDHMKALRPQGWLSGLCGKNVFTEEAYESDRAGLLKYYADQGYPEARIGRAHAVRYKTSGWRWFPWPNRESETRLTVTVPVEAGRLYRVRKVRVAEELRTEAGPAVPAKLIDQPYSAKAVEAWRRAWFAKVNGKPGKFGIDNFRGVDATEAFDDAEGTVNVTIGASTAAPIVVERIDVRGLHKFKDRFVRSRLVLEEGAPFDERALEAGLARLARTGYIRAAKKEDVHVLVDERTRTARVMLEMHEVGQQRLSLSGGQSTLVNSIGLAYSIFDLLNREELVSTQLEGGPETALLLFGLAKDGFLLPRASLAISVFDNFVRPRLTGTAKGPFYTARSMGVSAGSSFAVTTTDSIGVNYSITRNATSYSVGVPRESAETGSEVTAKTDSRAFGFGWTRNSRGERIILDSSLSGGWLGGDENVLRSSAEYSRILHDRLFDERNAWAFRLYARGAGSYFGDLPLYARLFGGDQLVRGLRPGELGPYAEMATIDGAGSTKYSSLPAGANLLMAANLEYRVPLGGGVGAAAFFDFGSGRMVPGWLGSTRPKLFTATNAVLHGSTGLEMSWTVPGIEVPVRAYYAVNVLRLNQIFRLTDGTATHIKNRWSAFGWALGMLF